MEFKVLQTKVAENKNKTEILFEFPSGHQKGFQKHELSACSLDKAGELLLFRQRFVAKQNVANSSAYCKPGIERTICVHYVNMPASPM